MSTKNQIVDPPTALVSDVCPNPNQPRTYFKESALRSLARSIKKHGQRTPIEVKLLPKKKGQPLYEIIEGERRWRACQIAGIDTIRITIDRRALTAVGQHMLSLVANLHREGHNHMELSRAMKYQVDNGARVSDIAEDVDRSEPWVYQYLSLQKLTPELQEKMHPETPDLEMIRFNEALVIASLPSSDLQEEAYRLMLPLPVKIRLGRLRQYAEEVTGVKRRGRAHDTKRHIFRFVNRLSGDTERVLEMKSSDFVQIVASTPYGEVKELLDDLKTASGRLNELIQSIGRELEKNRVAKIPPQFRVVGKR